MATTTNRSEHEAASRSRRRQFRHAVGRLFASLGVLLVCAALAAPLVVVIVASLTTTKFVVFPPDGLTLHWYQSALENAEFRRAMLFSVWLAAVSALISTVFAVMLGLALRNLAQKIGPVSRFLRLVQGSLRALGVLPLMLPAIVMAVAILQFATRAGLYGSSTSFVMAHVLVTFPFAFIMVEVGFDNVGADVLHAARSLGASGLRTTLLVTLPLAAGGVAAAWAFSFIISFGEFTISVFLQSPTFVTIPVQIYNSLYNTPLGPDVTAISGVVAIVTIATMIVGLLLVRGAGGRLMK